MNGLKN